MVLLDTVWDESVMVWTPSEPMRRKTVRREMIVRMPVSEHMPK